MSSEESVLLNWQVPLVGPTSLVVLGVLSILFFWVPLVTPLIQLVALVQCLRTARWGLAEPWSMVIGVSGAFVGFGLFLVLEYRWAI